MQISITGQTTLDSGVIVLRTSAGEYAGRTKKQAVERMRRDYPKKTRDSNKKGSLVGSLDCPWADYHSAGGVILR